MTNAAPAPVPSSLNPASQVPADAPAVTAPASRGAKKTKAAIAQKRKIEAAPSPSAAEQEKAAAAAAAASTDTSANTPPPAASDGSTAATAPATAAPVPALPPAAGLPDPGVDVTAANTATRTERHVPWFPIGVLVLGVGGAVAMVARRRKNEEITIVDHDGGSPPVHPLPRHS
ncbi:MAG TPA: hypothetical protein VN032_00130 [Thermoanaerobaculia bacterium]|nr:hypothetical protein [Thermoanaerobaculia bacterium]